MDLQENKHENEITLASIIVPTWNGADYIEDCLNSLVGQDYPDFEVVVVDNASSDGTPDWVAKHFPSVTLIREERNLGFAGGANVGLQAAKGEILILFNQDAAAKPGWLAALVSGMLTAPEIGIAGCKILDFDPPTIQHAGGHLTMPLALSSHFGFGQVDTGQFDELKDVDFVTGAAIAIRREVLETIGYLDETLFFYFEDVDYCYQARAAGFRVVYIPSAVLHHHSNTSLGAETEQHYMRFHTSRLQFILKHWGVDYFISQLYPAEHTRLNNISQKERVGLRQAYQAVLAQAIALSKRTALDDKTRATLFLTIGNLRQQLSSSYSTNTEQLLERPFETRSYPDSYDWWQVQEQPFTSEAPLIGSLIAWFRTQWNSVSTKWFVRAILHQQNKVNYKLVQALQLHSHILQVHSQVLYDQTRLLNSVDNDQSDQDIQVSEILCRLDKIESHLNALKDKVT